MTCGIQYDATDIPPERCIICEDERQYINQEGQKWTTLEEIRKKHHNIFKIEERCLTGIGTEPRFAIGQRAILATSPEGNVLWDCISLVDRDTIKEIENLGGISAIAISHPHFYSSMVEWSHAFGNIPIYIHAYDSKWVMRHDRSIVFWEGNTFNLKKGMTIIRCGGHFEGSSVLHLADSETLLASDTIFVVSDRNYVSFMYSYPNLIPLKPSAVSDIVKSVEPFAIERIYGGWFGLVIEKNGKEIIRKSAERYLSKLTGR